MSNVNAIELRNVTKIYRRSHLGRMKEWVGVQDLSLDIRAGEVFGLLGLNGAGKTTTIKLLLGLLQPTIGSIHLLGQAMPDSKVLGRVGYLPEAAYLNKMLTGFEAVSLYAALSQIPKRDRPFAVQRALERVGMEQTAQKPISEYSKGMLQRISMAQALVHNPGLLIFDEPITGLDPLALKEIRQLIAWLKSQGKTIFFSSHDISEVEKVCDRIGILVNGRLVRLEERSVWHDKPGALEDLFVSTVSQSQTIGPLRFN